MLVAFAVLAVALAASGVFAVLAYTVARQTREFGIRMALGARGRDLERAELARAVKLALVGLTIGGFGAAWLSRFLSAFLYQVGRLDPVVYSGTAILILATALAAAYVPARKGARVDPARSLRAE